MVFICIVQSFQFKLHCRASVLAQDFVKQKDEAGSLHPLPKDATQAGYVQNVLSQALTSCLAHRRYSISLCTVTNLKGAAQIKEEVTSAQENEAQKG